jgi:hypothetical protein
MDSLKIINICLLPCQRMARLISKFEGRLRLPLA